MNKNRKPNWADWRPLPNWRLLDAIALSLDIEPKTVRKKMNTGGYYPSEIIEDREFIRRATILYEIVESHDADSIGLILRSEPGAPLAATIRPSDFVRWVESEADDWLPLPQGLTKIASRDKNSSSLKSDKWPWGAYENELLLDLEAAARQFCSSGQPFKVDEVVEFLQARRVSGNIASAMATILRGDKSPMDVRTKAKQSRTKKRG